MLLEVRNLTKRFGGLIAVNDVSFHVEQGEIVGIFGPNGSGKTTTLSLISGMIKPTSGALLWNGDDITHLKPFQIAHWGVVKTFQNPQLFPELTVFDHMRIACHLHLKRTLGWKRLKSLVINTANADVALDTAKRVDHILELCRLTDVRHELAANLSYGAEKMIGVAMAMMCEPKLLLLDEPASGLGKDEIGNLDAVLKDLRNHGTTMVVIDHKVGFLGNLADRSVVLHHGAKIADGTIEDVLAREEVIAAYLGKKHA